MSSTDRGATPEDHATLRRWSERLERLGHLYRYVSLRGERLGWCETTVMRSQLYFVPLLALNDPFDGRVWPTDEGTDQEKRAMWEDHLRESGRALDAAAEAEFDRWLALPPGERMRAVHEEEVAKLGVACFTETPDDLPMWAYYADAHGGACLRFRAAFLLEGQDRTPPMRVTYEDDYPTVSFYRASEFRRARLLAATKAKVWCHEREWRMVRYRGRGPMQFDPAALDGVIMGCRMSAEDEARVRNMVARRPGVELLKARVAEREFRLDILPAQ